MCSLIPLQCLLTKAGAVLIWREWEDVGTDRADRNRFWSVTINVPGESGAILSITFEYIQLTPTKRTVAGFSTLQRSLLPPSLALLLSFQEKCKYGQSGEEEKKINVKETFYSPTVRLMTAGQFSSENSERNYHIISWDYEFVNLMMSMRWNLH